MFSTVGCSVPRGVFGTVGDIMSTIGGYLEYRGGCSGPWEYHDKCTLSTLFSTVEDITSTVGVILSTMGDTQYHGGYHDAHREYHDARGGYHVYHGGKIFCYLSTPTVLNTPMILMISPTCIITSSHNTQITKDNILPRY